MLPPSPHKINQPSGSPLDFEDILHCTLNGLPPTYAAFKTAIQTSLQPMGLYDLYSLLCSEETSLANDAARNKAIPPILDSHSDLFTNCGRGRGRSFMRGRSNFNRGRGRASNPIRVQCQICGKPGHSASTCWHRSNLEYQPPNSNQQALYADSTETNSDWILDTGATSHLTSDFSQLSNTSSYNGSEQVTLGNGQSVPIS